LAAKREYTLNFGSIFPDAAKYPSAILSMAPFDHRSMHLAFKWEPDINVVGEATIREPRSTRAQVILMDLTGVVTINAEAANHLIRMVEAARVDRGSRDRFGSVTVADLRGARHPEAVFVTACWLDGLTGHGNFPGASSERREGRVIRRLRLGGLLSYYERAAA